MLQYFEARVVTPICDTDVTAVENTFKSSSKFFKSACKAGPWVPDRKMDTKLSMSDRLKQLQVKHSLNINVVFVLCKKVFLHFPAARLCPEQYL